MAFTPIADSDFNGHGARSLPDQPTISANELKRVFDEDAREIVAPAVNRLIGELEATSASASVGAVAPTGRTGNTVQSLLNDISTAVDGKSTIQLSNVSTSGVRIATVTINGASTDLKASASTGGGTWGTITGTLSDQTDLQTALNGKANSSHTHSASDITSGLAAVATTNSYNSLDNKPTVDQSYSSSSTNAQSGTAVADAISGISFPVNDAFKKVKVGQYEITASDEDTIEFAQGANVTITPDVGNKKITISATGGGGGGGGDMYMAVYDTNEDGIVNSADTIAGLTATVAELNILDGVTADASEINILDGVTASTAELNILDGVTASASELNILDGATLTTTELNYVDGVTSGIQSQLNGKAASDHTHTLTMATDSGTSAVDLAANTKYKLTAGGSTLIFKTPEDAGSDIAPVPSSGLTENDVVSAVNDALTIDGGANEEVPSLFGMGLWANTDCIILMAQVDQSDDGLGAWNDNWKTDGIRSGWLWDESLYQVLEDGNGNRRYDIHIEPDFDVAEGEVVSLYSMRIDDDYTLNGVHGGCVAFKFNGEIQNTHAYVGVKLTHLRTKYKVVTPLT